MSDWRREAVPAELCRCEHSLEEHNIERVAAPCARCVCPGFALTARRWREWRTVVEEVK